LKQASVMVVKTNRPAALASLPGIVGVAHDRMRVRVPDEPGAAATGLSAAQASAAASTGCASTTASCPLQWDLARIHVPDAWKTTQGSPAIKVAVLDTGLTSKHEAVGSNYLAGESVSFVQPNPFCAEDAVTFSSTEDFNGHGTWTNTHVAGVNGKFMTGIAPKTSLVNIRVLGACGFGFDSWVLQGMIYGGIIGARVESMSLGGYLCADGVIPDSPYCSDPTDPNVIEGPTIYKAYGNVVDFLRQQGTLVVAAAGNELSRLNHNGRFVSRASLAVSSPTNDPFNDLHGLASVPAGVRGVVAVGAVNRVTVPALARDETRFGQFGVGRRDQLPYYSTYGERVDVSAPGGARRYNVPRFDCLSALCTALGPSAPGGVDNTGDFGASGIDDTGKPCTNCYQYIQGTSMATPQVAGVAALALAVRPQMSVGGLAQLLRRSVTNFSSPNATPPADEDPNQPTYNYDLDYDGAPVANRLMGSGVIDASLAVRNGRSGGGGDGRQGDGGN
jgi:subtilisin family serine protease